MKKGMLKNNKGVSLVLLALSIVVLFGFAALAVDVGHMYHVKNQLQVAADAAALAGADLLSGNATTQTAARNAAQRIAALNMADVAYDTVPGFGQSPDDTPAGQPIPVALQLNTENAADGDIVVGNWDAATGFQAGVTPINAIKVYAKRFGTIDAQPRLQNWFARVFALLPGNPDFSLASAGATAIAAKGNLPILPIAVNEYWDEDGWVPPHGPHPGEYPAGAPYGQRYPQSFMRQTNADIPPTPGLAGTANNIFAVVGGGADKNNVSNNMNGYVNILYRNEYHNADIHPDTWHVTNTATAIGGCASGNCNLDFPNLGTGLTNSMNQDKFGEVFSYLFDGMPDNLTPPNAVREIIRTMPTYTGDNYNSSPNANDPSECPYATIPYFSGSGNLPNLPQGPGGRRFYEQWPRGSQFMVMVYDGTGYTGGGSQAPAVTVIGYGVIEIDGYSNDPFNGSISDLDPGGPGGGGGNTAYGHAIPHGLAGEEDPYLIQPTDADRTPDCTFTDKLRDVQASFGRTHLVDPSLHYGAHYQP